MSEQPSPESSTDTSAEGEFGGKNLLIGFVIGVVLQFGWWALLDRLPLRSAVLSSTGFMMQFLEFLDQSRQTGFLLGATLGATANPAHAPIRSIIGKAIRWAFGLTLALYALDVVRLLLRMALGKSLGDIVSLALFSGLCGAFLGLVYVLKQSVAPDIERAPVSFRQFVKWTLHLDRPAIRRVLVAALLGALLGTMIEMLLQGLSAWPLMALPIFIVAFMTIYIWKPSNKTLKRWATGIWSLFFIMGLLLLLGLNAMLGTLAGIVVLVAYAVIQLRKSATE